MQLPRHLGLAVAVATLLSSPAHAHCDGLDGPVVTAAKAALASGDVDAVLIWVQPGDEAAIREAFARTAKLRQLGPEVRELADTSFFETLVRLHRAGEGAAYTGLAPAGRDLGPMIPAADRALVSGELAPLEQLLVERMRHGVRERFEHARAARGFGPHDVAAGRAYVESYVAFIHYVERLHEAAAREVEGHYAESAPPHAHR